MRAIVLSFMLLLGSSDGIELAVRSSRNGEFRAFVSVSGEAKRWPDVRLWQAAVEERSGRILYRLAREVPFDSPFPSLVLSDSGGSSVLFDAFEGWVEFYSGSGALLNSWRVFGEGEPDYERSIRCSVAGDRAAFLLSGTGGRPATVHLTDMRGDPLMEVTLNHRQAGELHMSDDASVIVAGSYSAGDVSSFVTSCIRGDGTILRTIPILFRAARVSPNGEALLLAGRRDVLEVALESQELKNLWAGKRSDELVTDVCYAGPFRALLLERVILSEGLPHYTERDVILLDAEGSVRMEKKLDGISDTPGSLTVAGEILTVSTGSRTVRIRVVE